MQKLFQKVCLGSNMRSVYFAVHELACGSCVQRVFAVVFEGMSESLSSCLLVLQAAMLGISENSTLSYSLAVNVEFHNK